MSTAKAKTTTVKLHNAALDDAAGSPAGVVLRGALALESLFELQTDDYQREAAPMSSQGRILDALVKGTRLPDVVLGMRGEDFTTREGSYFLKDPVFIIDGLQRISTIRNFKAANPDVAVHIGATVHFLTEKEWEREQFHKLNNWRNKLSPNILLRNMRETNRGVEMLYNLSRNDKAFPLHHRVSWQQKMTKGELVSAFTFLKSVAQLHGHKVSRHRTSVDDIADGMAKLAEVVGIQNVRENMRTFYDVIDACWGIKSVQYKEGAIYMRGQFLFVLGCVFSDHKDFWLQQQDEKRLFVNADLRRKIAQFPIHDPHIANLAGSSGASKTLLYNYLVAHINKGKTTKKLTLRAAPEALDDDEPEDTDADHAHQAAA